MAYTTINDSSVYFQSILYTGAATSVSPTFTGNANLQPDAMWIKSTSAATNHNLYDSSRGSTERLYPNLNSAVDTVSGMAFNSDGFTTGTSSVGDINVDGSSYQGWGWKCNAGTTASNYDGSITSTVQVTTTAGFSIITYTGTGSNGTIGHGLNSAPEYWVVKPRTNVSDNQWFACHKNINDQATDYADYFIHWDTDGGKQDNNLMWNDTVPTSSVISLGTKAGTNSNGGSFVCYAWHSVKGFSKFGGYSGNGNDDGPFVYCGFKPSLVWAKRTDSSGGWFMWSKDKPGYNVVNQRVLTNTAAALDTSNDNRIDILSNGFKIRDDANAFNNSSGKYMYMAFAENPLVATNDVIALAK
tara:strand:- start:81 stop:1151 length:1071 start_codon:yes stop_codon:yes gene_type:complete